MHILNRAFAENGVEITRHWPQMLFSTTLADLAAMWVDCCGPFVEYGWKGLRCSVEAEPLVTAKFKFCSKNVVRKNFCWQEVSPTMTSA